MKAQNSRFFNLFEKGHCASSARHTHEQMLILNSETDVEKQTALADRACNPNIQDICRLFIEWRKQNYGVEDGTEMFTKLQRLVDQYNENNGDKGGKALLQWCETTIEKSDSEGECTQKAKRKKRAISQKPLIL